MDKINDDDLVTYYVTDENGKNDGGWEVKSADDETGWGELIPFN